MNRIQITTVEMVEVSPGCKFNRDLLPFLRWEYRGWPPTLVPFLADFVIDMASAPKGACACEVTADATGIMMTGIEFL